jgi:hypothetical protein
MLVAAVPIYYYTEKPFMNGPGTRFLERGLRAVAGMLRRETARSAGETG